MRAPRAVYFEGFFRKQEVHHLDQLGLSLVHPGYVLESDLALLRLVVDLRLVPADAERPALRHPLHDEEPDAGEEGDGQQPDEEEALEPGRPLDETGELGPLREKVGHEGVLVDAGEPGRHDPPGFCFALGP
jgi:hypothetical protein